MPGTDASVTDLAFRGMRFLLSIHPDNHDNFSIQFCGQDKNTPPDYHGRLVFLLPDTKPFRKYAQVHRDLDSFLKDNSGIVGERRLLEIHLVAPEVYFRDFPALINDQTSHHWLLRAHYTDERPSDFTLTCGLFPCEP